MMKKKSTILILALAIFSIQYSYSTPPTLKTYHFKIKGTINYESGNNSIGVYGCKVMLFMRKKVNKDLREPVGIGLDPKDLTAVLNEKGEFNFDLHFQADLHDYDRISLVVSSEGSHGFVKHYDKYHKFLFNNPWYTVRAIYDDIGYSANAVELGFYDYEPVQEYNHNLTIKMEPQYGDAVRTLKYGYDCSNKMFGRLNLNLKMKPITISILKSIESDIPANGKFSPTIGNNSPFIELKEGIYDKNNTTASHEYAHYFHYALNYTHIPSYQYFEIEDEKGINYSREAFAEFYGNVIRNYISSKCGIPIPNKSNFENIPFAENRFSPASYGKVKNKVVARRAAYLWNIYDGISQIDLGDAHVDCDNDDVDGGKDDLFKKLFMTFLSCSLGEITDFAYFNDKLKNQFSDPELKNSIQKIYDCMMGDGSKKMRPVQVESTQLTSIPFTNNLNLKVSFSEYKQGSSYENPALGFILYGYSGNNDKWEAVKDWGWNDGSETQNFNLTVSDLKDYSAFKITSYNVSGTSCFPVAVKYEKLGINIIGSTNIDADKTYMWNSQISGGSAPYTYEWKVKKSGQQNYLYIDPNKCKSDEFSMMAPNGEDFTLELIVKDKNGVVGYTTKNINTTIKPLSVNINGPFKIGANLEGNWSAEVSGGVPPYSYSWSKDIEDGPTLIYFGKGKNLKINSGLKSFDLKLTVKDVKDKSVFTSKHVTIDQEAPMNVELTGDKITYLHKPGNWKVNATGGAIPYKATTFKKRKEGSNTFSIMKITTADSCEYLFTEEGVYYLEALVTGNDNKIKYSQELKVTVIYQPIYAEIINFFTQHHDGSYYINARASVSGGKPAYYYQWSIGRNLNDLKIIPGGNEDRLKHHKVGPFPGTYLLELKVSDTKWNSIRVYRYVQVGDPLDIKIAPLPPNLPVPIEIDDIKLSNYPNPTSGVMNLNYELKESSMVEIYIVDSKTGARAMLLKERQVAGRRQFSKNLGYFNNGVYEIQVNVIGTNNKRKTYTSRLVITK